MKKALTLCLAGLMSMTLVGCDAFTGKITKEQWKSFKIISIKPPKHFYVGLQDVETGEIYENIYVRKTCGNWRNLKVGSIWVFRYIETTRDSGKIIKDIDVNRNSETGEYQNLCDKIW